MYSFIFYFFYRLLWYQKEDDRISVSKVFTFIIVGLHIITIWKVLAYFDIVGKIPVFSKVYLYNKYIWFLPLSIVMALVFVYFRMSISQVEWLKKADLKTFNQLLESKTRTEHINM